MSPWKMPQFTQLWFKRLLLVSPCWSCFQVWRQRNSLDWTFALADQAGWGAWAGFSHEKWMNLLNKGEWHYQNMGINSSRIGFLPSNMGIVPMETVLSRRNIGFEKQKWRYLASSNGPYGDSNDTPEEHGWLTTNSHRENFSKMGIDSARKLRLTQATWHWTTERSDQQKKLPTLAACRLMVDVRRKTHPIWKVS